MGAPDAFGFQDLGDRALGVEFDPMFGPAGDGTVSDIVGGLTGEEIPRR
jgi:diacylglycerol kinase family enzyme